MPFYAYVLKNSVTGKLYKGHCENLEERIRKHSYGHSKTTSHERKHWRRLFILRFLKQGF